ncbi:MAG: nucleotidyl transferase AbiEii/AbiGii toxin family protein [Deltaproteobacteria bacterium]|nr:nucleotidyl transferase AbiEii/AbiGii toxin family protein [Deltaproteobacteria bacterium]
MCSKEGQHSRSATSATTDGPRTWTSRGWSRSRARDYYDIWRVLGTYGGQMDLSDFATFLREKCTVRNVTFSGPEDFFQNPMIAYAERAWDQWLGPLVPTLPSFEAVITEVREQVSAILSASR